MPPSKTKCPWCGKPYSNAGAYTNHLKLKHPQQDTTCQRSDVSRTLEAPTTSERVSLINMEPFDSDEEEFLPPPSLSSLSSARGVDSDVQFFPHRSLAGQPLQSYPFVSLRNPQHNQLYPFQNVQDYKLARFFTSAKVSKTKIDEFFKDNLIPTSDTENSTSSTASFQSGHTLYKKIDFEMAVEVPSWTPAEIKYEAGPMAGKTEQWFHRNIIDCIRYILRQPAYAESMFWGPVRHFDNRGQRMYSEMNTGTWWWDVQETLPVGSTLIPILLASDTTHLTNYSGDKKLWPIYITVGNIKSDVRNKSNSHAWIPLALLPIPPKRVSKIPGYSERQQSTDALQTFHQIISYILDPLSDATTSEAGLPMICADENIRRCFPRLCAWLADHVENSNIHGTSSNRCPTCIIPANELGEYPEIEQPQRSHTAYMEAWSTWSQSGDSTDAECLEMDRVHCVNNALWHVRELNPPDLIRADLLHTIYLGLLKHLMTWIQSFLDDLGRLPMFDSIWKSIPPYPGFTAPNKPYRSVTQWTGKELRNLGKIILAVFTASLSRTSDAPPLTAQQKSHKKDAITCVRYLTDYALMLQYPTQTEANIELMSEYLRDFHRTKYVFLRYRAGKNIRGLALAAKRRIVSEQLLNQPDELSSAQKLVIERENRIEREQAVEEILMEGSHFNFPKMHLVTHYPEQIRRFGSLPQYSTEVCEASHKPLKDAYRRSNHVNFVPQIIKTHARHHKFAMLENNLQAWAKKLPHVGKLMQEISRPTTSSILPLRPKLRLQGPQNRMKPCSISELTKLLDLPDLETLTDYYFQKNIFGGPCPSDTWRLLDAPLEFYNTLQVPVQTLEGGYVLHHVRCTGKKAFRNSQQRADWVWVRRYPRSPNSKVGALDGRIPGRLNALFKIRMNSDNHRLAHVTLTKCVGKSTPMGEEGMIKVKHYEKSNVVVRIGDIEGMAHLILIEDGLWLINNRIDIYTWEAINDGL